jgi:hypothetical protein
LIEETTVPERYFEFDEYIEFGAHYGANRARNDALCWLRNQFLMGTLPALKGDTALQEWQECFRVFPAEHRPAAAKLWREYVRARRYADWYRHRRKRRRKKAA